MLRFPKTMLRQTVWRGAQCWAVIMKLTRLILLPKIPCTKQG
ncbi:hypothetical protein MGSAQ_002900 [marine sediment metagenome]|uniref:Uncharacterized protein n=1 Tax=marine sediment metagenome TaxID=412755 RepID=A0A1B6NQ77_9ZZZZ